MIATLVDKAEGPREMYREKGRRIAKTLGDPFAHEVNRDMLSGYVAKRLNQTDEEHSQASPRTVSKERTIPIAPALKYLLDQVPTESRRGAVVERWGNVRRDLPARRGKTGKPQAGQGGSRGRRRARPGID